jgi:hypothetical protein
MDVGLKGQKEISFKKILHTSELKRQICQEIIQNYFS